MHYGIFLLLLFTTVNLAAGNETSVSLLHARHPRTLPGFPSIFDLIEDIFELPRKDPCIKLKDTVLDYIFGIFGITLEKPELACSKTTTPKPPKREKIFDKVKRYLEEIKPYIELALDLLKYFCGIANDDDSNSKPKPPKIIVEIKIFIDEVRPYCKILLWYLKYIFNFEFLPGSVLPKPPKIVDGIKIIIDTIKPSIATILEFIKSILGIGKQQNISCDKCCNKQKQEVILEPQIVMDALEKFFEEQNKNQPSTDLVIKPDTQKIIDDLIIYFGGENVSNEPSCPLEGSPVYVKMDWKEFTKATSDLCELDKIPEPVSNLDKNILDDLLSLVRKNNRRLVQLDDAVNVTLQNIEHVCTG